MTKPHTETAVESLSLEAALSERALLVKEVMDIQVALGDKNRMTAEGRRMGEREYFDWRHRAQFAMTARNKRITDLKEHIRKLRAGAAVQDSGVGDTSDPGLLKSAYGLLRKLSREGVDFEAAEQALMDVLRDRLQNGKAL